MNDISAIKAQIAAAARALEAAVRHANDELAHHSADFPAVTYEIPSYDPDQPERDVPVTRQTGENARIAARRMYASIDYEADQHPVTVRRLPGIVTAPAAVIPAFEQLNQAKDHLKRSVRMLPRGRWARERGTMARAATLCLLQAYRRVRILEHGAERVSFIWDRRGASGKRITVAKAREMIADPGHYGPVSDLRQQQELAALADLSPDEPLLQRKPITPTPAANVWPHEKSRPETFRVDMPLLVILHDPAQAPKIHDLDELIADSKPRKQRSDRRAEAEPLIERLYLYRYQDGWRSASSDRQRKDPDQPS